MPEAEVQLPIKVSVLCLVYNHEKYIEDALRGFLMQKVDFPVEFLIGDDCSTDRSAEIIKRYAALDSRIVPVLRERNLGSGARNFEDLASYAKGEYLALCEGDDYWTDPEKLARQVALLDQNPQHSMCFHPVRVTWEDGREPDHIAPSWIHSDISIRDLIPENVIHTPSVMYRWRGLPDGYFADVTPSDHQIHLIYAAMGSIGFIDRAMSVYRRHAAGIWTSKNIFEHRRRHFRSELAFYTDVIARHKDYAHEFHRHVLPMFQEYATYLVEREEFEELSALASQDRSISADVFRKMGFRPEQLDFKSGSALRSSMGKQHKVSVIVLANGHDEKAISRSCDSVVAQRGYFDMEVVLCGSASNKPIGQFRDACGEQGPNVVVVECGEAGTFAALDLCLRKCSGHYVAILEAGDYFHSHHALLKRVHVLAQNPDYGICASWTLLDTASGALPHHGEAGLPAGPLTAKDIVRGRLASTFSSRLYRRKSILQLPPQFLAMPGVNVELLDLQITERDRAFFLKENLSVARQCAGPSPLAAFASRKRAFARFGGGKGFDNTNLVVERTQIGEIPKFRAWLDQPLRFGLIEQNAIRFTGWVVHESRAEPQVAVRRDGEVVLFPVNAYRIDVMEHLKRARFPFIFGGPYGFDFTVPFHEGEFDFGFSVGGEITWWLRLEARIGKAGHLAQRISQIRERAHRMFVWRKS